MIIINDRDINERRVTINNSHHRPTKSKALAGVKRFSTYVVILFASKYTEQEKRTKIPKIIENHKNISKT